MSEVKNVPEIRFAEFTNAWEQRKLEECFKKKKKKNGDRYTREDVLAVSDTYGCVNQIEFHGRSFASEDISNYKIVRKGDIIYTKSPLQAKPYGIIKIVGNETGIISPLYVVNEAVDNIDSMYMYYLFDTPERTNNYLCPLVRKGAKNTMNISNSEWLSGEVTISPDKQEQQLIGTFFRHLDNLITLHQRKHDKLVVLKKAMLEKMFPQKGNNVPEVRFAGFTAPWEQRKLLDCIQKITDFRGRTPKKLGMDWSESGYLALSALNVKDGYIDFSQDVHYGDQALYDKWMTGNELHKGQVLFTTEAPMGNVAQIPDNRRYILSQRTIAFDVKSDLITENFLATVLRAPTVFASLTALSSGGTAKGVSQKTLTTVDITIPANLNEQEQLASMFSDIDNLITLHQRKHESLKHIKAALLQKMFV